MALSDDNGSAYWLSKNLRWAFNRSGGCLRTIRKAIIILHREGIAGVRQRVSSLMYIHKASVAYEKWICQYDEWTPSAEKKIRNKIESVERSPLISVIMPVFDPPIYMLEEAIESVLKQVYANWELCIADDASGNPAVRQLINEYIKTDHRINAIFRDANGHISKASNSALELAHGDYIALLDHDDKLAPDALYRVAAAVTDNPNASIIYSDEDKFDESGKRVGPYFKSDWNYELFLSHNLISHLGVYKTSLVRHVGGFREGLEGSQDYDLAARCIEHIDSSQIVHIPRVLYHWRIHKGSAAYLNESKPYAQIAAIKAIQDHFDRTGHNARAEKHAEIPFCRVRFMLPSPAPAVSLIILARNGLSALRYCVESILNKTEYPNFEIMIIYSGPDNAGVLRYCDFPGKEDRIRFFHEDRHLNHSALYNEAAKNAYGEIIGFVNDDIEPLSREWLLEMASVAIQPGVGAVGARLWYPDGRLQHAGLILGMGGVAGHSHKGLPRHHHGYCGRAKLLQSFSAVSGACLVIKKSIYEEVNGWDENLSMAFNDVDFCLKVRSLGFRNVWTPFAELINHELETVGCDTAEQKQDTILKEAVYMKCRWGDALLTDPAYSPNLTLDDDDYSLAWPPRREVVD